MPCHRIVLLLLAILQGLPAEEPHLWLCYWIGIKDGAAKSDGVLFTSSIQSGDSAAQILDATPWRENAWHFRAVDLTRHRGKPITLRLTADPGKSTADDWGVWGDAALVESAAAMPTPATISNARVLRRLDQGALGRTGLIQDGKAIPLVPDSGGVVQAGAQVCAGVTRRGFFMHPCWKGPYARLPVFAEFDLDLAQADAVVDFKALDAVYTASTFASPGPHAYLAEQAAWDSRTREAQKRAAMAMLDGLEGALARGEKRLVIPQGDYRFDSNAAARLSFSNLMDVELDARGATFWLEPYHALTFSACRRVTLDGLTLDHDPLPFTQGVVVAWNAMQAYAIVRIIDGFPMPENGLKRKTMCLPFKAGGTMIPHQMDFVSDLEVLQGRYCKVRLQDGALFNERQRREAPIGLGDVLVLPPRGRGTLVLRDCAGVVLRACVGYSSGGLSILEWGGAGGNFFDRCRLTRRPGTRRFIAGNADGIHSARMRHGPRIEGCEMEYLCDDFVNLHGYFSLVEAIEGPSNLLIASPYGLSFGAGTLLSFHRFDDMRADGKAAVARLEPITDKRALDDAFTNLPRQARTPYLPYGVLHRVTLDQPISTARLAFVSEDEQAGRGAVIKGNYFHDNNRWGILVKSPQTRIEGNRFERTGGPAVAAIPEQRWLEGPLPSELCIRGNTLVENCRQIDMRTGANAALGSICFLVSMNSGACAFPPSALMAGSLIEGNDILRPGNAGIFIANGLGVVIRSNRIRDPGAFPSHGNGKDVFGEEVDAAIYLVASKGNSVSNNRLEGGGAKGGLLRLGKGMAPADVFTDGIPPAKGKP